MILKGDCIEVMKAMKSNSVDAIVTDPPYGLEFMGKEWDKLWDKREFGIDEYSKKSYTCSDGSTRKTNPVSRKLSNPNYKAGIEAQLWHTQWLTEAHRVLKPGGSMLVMGGTRTFHRLACAIEDSGFIIKDTLMWIYGSGFPKAQDLGKMIDKRMGKKREIVGKRITGRAGTRADKRNANLGFESGQMMINETLPSTDLAKHWDGFKVGGIKPAYEPIIWAVKPPEGSYIDNVLKWGVGAVNVDECRISHNGNLTKGGCTKYGGMFGNDGKVNNPDGNSKGRFPANIILSHHPECQHVGMKKVKGANWKDSDKGNAIYINKKVETKASHYTDSDGLEKVESWDCHPDCAVRLLDEQSGDRGGKWGKQGKRQPVSMFYGEHKKGITKNSEQFIGDSGGASRFYYCAKSSRAERNAGLEGVTCTHPTVKPIKLFEWLIKLVTREGQAVLDPFIGSGTTAIAAHNAGRKCMGIEKEPEYLEIAKRRTAYWRSRPRQLEMIGG